MSRRILLGRGVLTWPRTERVSDRYGTMSTEFPLLKKDGVELSACESSAALSIDLYRLVTTTWEAEDCEPGDWAHLGSIEGVTKADLGILIRRLQEIYEMDTLF